MLRRFIALPVLLVLGCTPTVHIHSNPSGARVWVDGRDVGRTPTTAQFEDHVFIAHRVRLEKEGYEPYNGGLRKEFNPPALVAAVVCFCPPALLWINRTAATHTFTLRPLGGAPPMASGDAMPPAIAGDHTFTIVPGVPASAKDRFFTAMEAAARDQQLPVVRHVDGVQIEPESRITMRYQVAGDGVVLHVAIGEIHAPHLVEKEAKVRELHASLLDSAVGHAEKARAVDTPFPPQPTPEPTPELRWEPTPAPTRTPKPSKTAAIDRPSQEKRCASGVDCGPGEFCKDRGDGLKLCMGNNVRGEFCSTGIDCAPSLFCRDRGDGLKVCMGKGRRGDPCASGIDCDGTLRCKNAGDGLKTCM